MIFLRKTWLLHILNTALLILLSFCSSTEKDSVNGINPKAIELNNQVSLILQEESLFRGVFPNDSLLIEALDLVNQAIECDSLYALAYSNKASVLCRFGRYNEAINTLKHVSHMKPNYAEAIQAQGFIYEKLGRMNNANEKYHEALIAFNNRIKKDPQNIQFMTGKAFLLLFIDGKDNALAEINDIIDKHPGDRTAIIMKETISSFNRADFITAYN